MNKRTIVVSALLCVGGLAPGHAAEDEKDRLEKAIRDVEPKVIEWRRDIHQHPELSNRETRTAKLVADHLRGIGLDEVHTEIAHTGVVGILKGGKPGPIVALRADMDALPVTEQVNLPFASKVRTTYNGQEVGVMHACGHDNHVAILMGAAEVLAEVRESLPGTIEFVFQPAEEGAPEGEEGGATLMIEEGVLDKLAKPEAIFGLHVWPSPSGTLDYRSGGALAASDWLRIVVTGRQTHGSSPWLGIDPIIVAAQIMAGLQTIPSRQMDITKSQSVVTIGSIHGGVRGNIIPDEVVMDGTIRTFDPEMREDFLERITRTAEQIAESAGAKAEVSITSYSPVTYNDPALTEKMLPSLRWAAGDDKVAERTRIMGAEDFSFYQQRIPGFFFILGVNKEGVEPWEAASNHSPFFYANEDALIVGVRAMVGVAWDYLNDAR